MSLKLLVLIEVSLLTSLVPSGHSSLSTTSCPGSLEPLISGPVYRVENDQIRASSSYDGDYLPHDARITSGSWCSANTGGHYWIEVDFGTNVIIHELQIGGHDGFFDSYLRMFQVEYGPDDDQLTPILQDNTPRVFTRPSEHSVQTTLLPSPIVTRVLRIIPVDWSESVPCVRLEALGCIQTPGCDSEVILSTNRSLLPLSSIIATSASSGYTAQRAVDEASNDKWCTSEPLRQGAAPYIMFTFTERVVLTYMRARGGPAGVSYVTRFSVDVRDNDSQSFTSYTLLTDEEADFSTNNAAFQTHTFWNQPLEGQTFRFKIQDRARSPSSEFCWNVQLFGCVASEPEVPSKAPLINNTTTTTVAMTTQVSAQNDGSLIRLVVGVAVGGAIFLTFFILCIILLFVCLVLKNRALKERSSHVSDTEHSVTVERFVTNSLYGKHLPSEYATPKQNMHQLTQTPAVYSYASTKARRVIHLPNTSRTNPTVQESSLQTGSKRDRAMVQNRVYISLQRVGSQDESRGDDGENGNSMLDNNAYSSVSPWFLYTDTNIDV